tara:strand:+ start:22090 stop:23976 length:1887 start_codon:yes stop_codon:yes gene_type:complete
MERASEMGRAKMRHSMWVRTCRDFLKCHRRPINVALHVITTPMGLVGFLGLLGRINPLAMTAVAAIYMAALWPLVPKRVWFVTTIVVAAMVAGVMIWNPVWWIALVTLVLGYVGQETAHLVAGEATLQSTYIQTDQRFKRFAEHTLLLLPVLLVIASRPKQSPLRLFVARDAVLATKLTAPDPKQDLKSIRDWVREKHPTVEQSTHWWQSDLDDAAGDAFERLSHDPTLISMIRRFHGTGYTVEPVLGMNELYVTGPPKQRSSDTVFYRGHVDGPWAVFPGARLYRCMLAASPNAEVTTHFPMMGTDYEKPHGFRLEDGDAVAFDFNRELHYITRDVFAAQQEPRVNLKLHFVAYPTALPFYGKMLADWTTNYDIRARNLFLNTIAPDSRLARLKAGWVLGWTKIFESAVHYVGWTNLAYVASMATIGMALQSLTWFLLATSFVHYLIYLGTIREPTQVSFGTFRRDAVFFKAVSMTSLFGIYAANFGGQWLSLACVVTGFALATYATSVLGVNRTYFSTELGFDTPQRATRWPYNMIPHPMILGALLGIASMSLVPSMREQYGWLIATHLAFYLVVLFQEIVVWSNSTRRPDNTTFGTIARPRPNAACDDFLESLRTPKSRDARHEK